jgi:hypothetical protein
VSDPIEDDLRAQVRACVEASGRAQVVIAAELGITPKHLCAMRIGRAALPLAWAQRIAEACGYRVAVALVRSQTGPWRVTRPGGAGR